MAAEEALHALADQLGPGILRGRIEGLPGSGSSAQLLLKRFEAIVPPGPPASAQPPSFSLTPAHLMPR